MKTIRIILLILILFGLTALATQKLWVPTLVQKIISAEDKSIPVQQIGALKDGQQCYTYSHDATKEEPYAVQEFLTLNVQGTAVTGTKTGTQNGPDMTNGYQGTIKGTVHDATINSTFSYTIEGSSNTEQEIYTIRPDQIGIEKLRYPLKEEGKMLVPDMTKPYSTMLYARVGCNASN